MTQKREKGLRERITSEMVADHADALERNYEIAKKWIRLTTAGKVEIPQKERLTAKEQVQLYVVGKLYAAEADLSESVSVANDEFLEELGLPRGTLLPTLKELRDGRRIERIKEEGKIKHYMPRNMVERFLGDVDKKLMSKEGG